MSMFTYPTTEIKIVFDNDLVTITDDNKLIARGRDRRYHKMANNVINNSDPKRYKVSEFVDGHKVTVVLNANHS
jgi:hypothetical protein